MTKEEILNEAKQGTTEAPQNGAAERSPIGIKFIVKTAKGTEIPCYLSVGKEWKGHWEAIAAGLNGTTHTVSFEMFRTSPLPANDNEDFKF